MEDMGGLARQKGSDVACESGSETKDSDLNLQDSDSVL